MAEPSAAGVATLGMDWSGLEKHGRRGATRIGSDAPGSAWQARHGGDAQGQAPLGKAGKPPAASTAGGQH